jgi:hypothetical protein
MNVPMFIKMNVKVPKRGGKIPKPGKWQAGFAVRRDDGHLAVSRLHDRVLFLFIIF